MMTKGKIYRCVVKWDGLEVNYQKKIQHLAGFQTYWRIKFN